ncbi:hypothetical protein VPH35_008190 [Triticum aestivum]
MGKGKEVVPPLEKGKEVVPQLVELPVQDHPKPQAEELWQLSSGVRTKPLLQEFKLKTNTDCAWRVTVRVINGRVGPPSPPFTRSSGMTFKLLTPDTMKVIVFNNEGMEVVTKCKEHGNAFAATA